jgi:hypothetical protein
MFTDGADGTRGQEIARKPTKQALARMGFKHVSYINALEASQRWDIFNAFGDLMGYCVLG